MSTSAIIQGFRDGLAAGDLLLQKCNACNLLNMYPRYACPHCQSDDLGWQKAAGTGTLMSVTVLRAGGPEGFEQEIPYALGIVRLDEGVQLLGRLIPDADGEWASYACDQTVAFAPATDKMYAIFRHAE
jgi:uncharacterized OB-fold protein